MDMRTVAEGLEFPEGPVALADGSVLLVEIFAGTLAQVSPDGAKTIVARGRHVEHHPMPDLMTTNLCFGGADLKTAFVTLSWTGRLVAVDWPVGGLHLNYTA